MSTPFLRWAGSKRKLLPQLKKYWQQNHDRYLEPFMGSACLFFELQPKNAVLSDINKDLVTTYTLLKERPEDVHLATKDLKNTKDDYYSIRAIDPQKLNPTERAARFIYLNRFCFNGLYRTNSKGVFNVPYSPSGTGKIPSKEHLIACSEMLQTANIYHGDFEQIVSSNVRPGDFVYLDPPFAIKNKRIFTQYDAHSFGHSDINRLSILLDSIVEKGADFLLSYAASDEVFENFAKWPITQVDIQRNISGFAKYRKIDQEVLISNNKLSI